MGSLSTLLGARAPTGATGATGVTGATGTSWIQTGFLAGISSASDITISANSLIPFNTVTATGAFNQNNNFNTTTYQYTAPINGRYLFSFTLYFTNSGSSNSGMQAGLYINGSFRSFTGGDAYGLTHAIPNNTGGVITGTATAILSLAANDTVAVAARLNCRIYQGHSYFSGHILGS